MIQTMKGTDRSLFPSSSNYLPLSLLTSISSLSLCLRLSFWKGQRIHTQSLPSFLLLPFLPSNSLPSRAIFLSFGLDQGSMDLTGCSPDGSSDGGEYGRRSYRGLTEYPLSLRTLGLCFSLFLFPHLKPIDRRTDRKGESVWDSERDREGQSPPPSPFPPGPTRL